MSTGRLPALRLSWAGDAENAGPDVPETDLRGRVARVERTLGRQTNDLGLLEGVRRVHELDAENFKARADEHEAALKSLALEVSELESKAGQFSGGDDDAPPESAKDVRARLDTLRASVRQAGELLTRDNAALAVRGRELLEIRRLRLCERAERCLSEVRALAALGEDLGLRVRQFAGIIAGSRRSEFSALQA